MLARVGAVWPRGRRAFGSAGSEARVAVVLSGCGVYDGAELTEAVATLVHLSRAAAKVACFAPDTQQMHVFDHVAGREATDEKRNVLVESARISRGHIAELQQLEASHFDAVIFPGGFGAAKNLSDFATKGADCTVEPQVERVLRQFHASRKPIGMCCIAPTLAARVLPAVTVTVGRSDEMDGRWPHAAAAGAIQQMGATHVEKELSECHVDQENRLVTSPAYMCNAEPHLVFDNVGLMVRQVLDLIARK